MNRIMTLAAAIILSIAASAEDFSLYYTTATAQKNEIAPVAQLQKITFENGNVVATLKDGTKKTTAIADISKLFFSSDSGTGIAEVKEETAKVKKGVYDLTGRKLNIDIKSDKLPKGIYIVDGEKIQVK